MSPHDPTKPKWERLLAECRRLIKLDPRLDLYLKGGMKPAGAGESCELALLCAWPSRRLFGEASRLYKQAFALEPRRPTDLRLGYRYPRRRVPPPGPPPERDLTHKRSPTELTGVRGLSNGCEPIYRSAAIKSKRHIRTSEGCENQAAHMVERSRTGRRAR